MKHSETVSAIFSHSHDTRVPEKEILHLADAIRKDAAVASECLKLFQDEIAAGNDANGTTIVWAGFALALARSANAKEAFWEIRERYFLSSNEDMAYEHYQIAIACLELFGDEFVEKLLTRVPTTKTGEEELIAWLQEMQIVSQTANDELRRRVADEAERMLTWVKPWPFPLQCCCQLLIAAAPARALSIVPDFLKTCFQPKRLTRMLRAVQKEGNAHRFFANKWQDSAKKLAEEFLTALNEGELEPREEFDDEERASDHIENLISAFEDSRWFQTLPPRLRESAPEDLHTVLDYLWRYTGALPEKADKSGITELMLDILPEKMTARIEWFKDISKVLVAFYSFLGERGTCRRFSEILAAINKNATGMVTQASDPRNWGLAKSHLIMMLRDGVDLSNQAEVDAWTDNFNRRILQSMSSRPTERPMEPDGGNMFAQPAGSAKVNPPDPYKPCPCGSGKKYKWCCRGRKG